MYVSSLRTHRRQLPDVSPALAPSVMVKANWIFCFAMTQIV